MEGNPAEHDEIVSQFCAMTGTQPSEVRVVSESPRLTQ
jgi:UBX domain-containing protein 1